MADSRDDSAGRRLRHIDGLRAIAVLSVVVFHAWKYAPGFGLQSGGAASLRGSTLSHFLSLGYHGVDLFFVLSGYCLAYPTVTRLRNSGRLEFDTTHYLARRVARILPPYEVALAGFAILLALFARAGWRTPPDMLSPLSAVNVLRDAVFLGHGTLLVNQSFWTLAVEWRWYFIFPLALALWLRLPLAFWLVMGSCVVASYFTHSASIDVAYLPAFMLGIVAVHLDVHRPRIVRYFPVLFVMALLAAFIFRLPAGVAVSICWQLALFAFVVMGGTVPCLRAVLAASPLVVVGVASYSIYLVHQPLIAISAGAVSHGSVGALVVVLITSAFGIAAGFMFWYVVERPVTSPAAKARLERLAKPIFTSAFKALALPRAFALQTHGRGMDGAEHVERAMPLEDYVGARSGSGVV